jgi:hypothetical protein
MYRGACEERFNLLEVEGWHDKFATICKPGHKEYVTRRKRSIHPKVETCVLNYSHLIYLQPTKVAGASENKKKLASSQGSGIRIEI